MIESNTLEYKLETEILTNIHKDFLYALQFCIHDTERDGNFWDNHLFSYISQDIMQSCISIYWLAHEGVTNPCKRELRFLLELFIKQCYIEQQMPHSLVHDKLIKYTHLLNNPSISIKSQIDLYFLPDQEKNIFLEDVGKYYGISSKYVHFSSELIDERIELIKRGVTIGYEGLNEIKEIVQSIRICYALIWVLLFHSIPSYVVGDWLVNSDGSSNKWYFRKSKYIALIDTHFDYKHERNNQLKKIQEVRKTDVEF
ncbi:MAG: hypothetical protein ACYC6G_02725 [Desulfobaccales bacterium]